MALDRLRASGELSTHGRDHRARGKLRRLQHTEADESSVTSVESTVHGADGVVSQLRHEKVVAYGSGGGCGGDHGRNRIVRDRWAGMVGHAPPVPGRCT